MQRREILRAALIAAAPALLRGRARADEAPPLEKPASDGPAPRPPAPGAPARKAPTPKAPAPGAAVPDARLTAPLKPPARGRIRVAFVISTDAEVVDVTGPWGVFEYVLLGDDDYKPFTLYTVAASKDPVRMSDGLSVVPRYTYADAPPPDVVVVPALNTARLAPAALDWLRAVQKNASVTLSVCNGAFVLAQAGLLDGKAATTHHRSYGMLRATYPKVKVLRGLRYVEDGKIATSGGLTSGVDLALRVVERYYGRDVAKRTARFLEYQATGWMFPASNAAFAEKPRATAERPVCPVCETQIRVKDALTAQYQGETYYFCSQFCKKHFLAEPGRFIGAPE